MARQGRGPVRDRLRLPPDHRRRRRRLAEGDGRARRRGHHQLQAVHGLPRRLLLRRRADPARDADRGRQRLADHDARRERHRHRRARRAGARTRRHRAEVSTARRGRGRPRKRRRTGRSCWRGSRARRCTSCTCRRKQAVATVAAARDEGLERLRRDVPAVPLPLARGALSAPRLRRRRSTCARRRCGRAPRATRTSCGATCAPTTSRWSAPTTARSASRSRRSSGSATSPKIPNGIGGVEHRMDLIYQGVVDGQISLAALGRAVLHHAGPHVRARTRARA